MSGHALLSNVAPPPNVAPFLRGSASLSLAEDMARVGGSSASSIDGYSSLGRRPSAASGDPSGELSLASSAKPIRRVLQVASSSSAASASALRGPLPSARRIPPTEHPLVGVSVCLLGATISTRSFEPPEDAIRLIVDFAAGTLLDLLSMALMDRHFMNVARRRLDYELRWLGTGDAGACTEGGSADEALVAGTPQNVFGPQVAQQFLSLPELQLSAPGLTGRESGESSLAAFAPFSEDEAVLHCQDCHTPILKVDDILSSNYRIMTGRAHLASHCYNVSVSTSTYEAHYTTGQYSVRNVSCGKCDLRIGITYVGANDRDNSYKIGKFLVGQHVFVRPTCCLLRSRRLVPSELPTPLCPRCQKTAVRGNIHLVKLMTDDLHVGHTRQLYELLLKQQAVETLANSATADTGSPLSQRLNAARTKLLQTPRALLSWCLPLLRSQSQNQQQDLPQARQQDAASSQPAGIRQRPYRPPGQGVPARRATALPIAAFDHAPTRAVSSTAAATMTTRPRPILSPDCWQETIRERVAMLAASRGAREGMRRLRQEAGHMAPFLAAVIRFIGVLCRVAKGSTPTGAIPPERVQLLLELLPSLVTANGRSDALRGARALVLTVRKEWVVAAGGQHLHAGGDRFNGAALTSGELESLVAAITACAQRAVAEASAAAEVVGSSSCPPSAHAPCYEAGDVCRPHADSGISDISMLSEATAYSSAASDERMTSEMEELTKNDRVFQCVACGNPVLKTDDILSTQYRIMTGPAYLANSAYNVHISEEDREAVYMSGEYTVRDVDCATCSSRLGVQYVGAVDGENQYKVGKFLVSQELFLPPLEADWPSESEAVLRGQLLDLIRRGSLALPQPHLPLAERPQRAPEAVAPEALAAPEAMDSQADTDAAAAEPLLQEAATSTTLAVAQSALAAHDASRQPLMLTIRRYIRCMMPHQNHQNTLPGGVAPTAASASSSSSVVHLPTSSPPSARPSGLASAAHSASGAVRSSAATHTAARQHSGVPGAPSQQPTTQQHHLEHRFQPPQRLTVSTVFLSQP
eukprot:TRINITY_DN30030_c0_g1_i1.p1 TRINITY_DN30030_c0_g1~~TRINITY_DN30030_c0_g1_i1.p1  ORF type:complete len:1040 (-),score=192.71 TRINITY_DN30030_c0_g1_i1:574-3693(-)